MSVDNPLVSLPPEEIPLRNAPLVRVIAQVRFPVIASIEKREFIASFQEVLRDTYPVLRQEKTQGVVLGPQGVASTQSSVVWRFRDIDEKWRLSLAPDFIAIETISYTSRNDFLYRFQLALDGIVDHIGPKIVDRLGLRYIDRIEGQDLEDINDLVRPEMVGILATPMASQAEQSVHEAILNVPESNAKLRARWGQVPPNSTVDPAAIEPKSTPSWLLDLDMFSTKPLDFDTANLMMHARVYAERIYTLFRWAVTDEFLQRYGGEL
ncbi:MAG: TIGR04255 family protein [Candidatus Tectomicrobia bacterium]|nr:TIGR04255 family protein [Candidatus Tectomicrobia bacterium]